tara:strand:+ start:2994 stop:3581 length:588 start_codon:yes stop_codon:yes gene_type:complete
MGKETSKAVARRLHDIRFATRYFKGKGIDIGCGPDPLSQYQEFFPLVESIESWDKPEGDAQFMESVADEAFDFVHSSHCLEHLVDPKEALKNWWRILKPRGHLVVVIPDEDLYEQGEFPSFNRTHRHTFTINKQRSWCADSLNLIDLLKGFSSEARILKIELLDASFRYQLERQDQTRTPIGESAIEFIVQKGHL